MLKRVQSVSFVDSSNSWFAFKHVLDTVLITNSWSWTFAKMICIIYLYVMATYCLWNNTLMEYKENWTRSYSLEIIYRSVKKLYLTGQSKSSCSTCRQFKSRKTNAVLLFSFKLNTYSFIGSINSNIDMLIS